MKDNVFPNWEDPENRNGGCLSFKISSDKIINEWNHLLFCFLNDMILSKDNHFINGISISPKKEFNIIKIWINNFNTDFCDFIQEYPPHFIKSKSIHRKHLT